MIKLNDLIDGRFRIISRLGTGGMADVYEANDIISKKLVCLKVMKEELLNDKENLNRFKEESRNLALLNHPNIIKIYGVGEIENRPYMANEYVKGLTLREKLNYSISLSLNETLNIMMQLTQGIAFVHKHGLIHRDIKPDNLFLLSDGTLKIADFGISLLEGSAGSNQKIQGTIYYCAPEVLLGNPVSKLNDIYSMGVLFYELLTGEVPFNGKNKEEVAYKQVKKKFPDVSSVISNYPKELDKLIAKACKKDPAERYQSAMDFYNAIADFNEKKDNLIKKKGLVSRILGFK
ncbi:MAG: serine/threonine-protein kinase [Bacilli bacterium]|nr:serine/threonine-protein kinase [Bacilli bacterium]MDY6430880.1 serine/threonine-protein kinase [Bacilli bacterium]